MCRYLMQDHDLIVLDLSTVFNAVNQQILICTLAHLAVGSCGLNRNT